MDRDAADVTPAELRAHTPQAILDALPHDIPWRIDRLWALELPTVDIPLARLDWLLDLPLWQYEGRRFQVTPRQVQREPDAYPHHLHRVLTADLAYPVHVVEHRSRLVILDGFHRLLKAVLEGRHTITAMRLTIVDLRALAAE